MKSVSLRNLVLLINVMQCGTSCTEFIANVSFDRQVRM